MKPDEGDRSELQNSREAEALGHGQTSIGTPPSVLTVDELAALLRVNRKTVYVALSRGDIPGARRIGGTYRILREAVIVWFTSSNGRVSHSKRKK